MEIGLVSRQILVMADASSTSWGALYYGQPALQHLDNVRKTWYITCLELLAVHLTLKPMGSEGFLGGPGEVLTCPHIYLFSVSYKHIYGKILITLYSAQTVLQ